MSKAYEDIIHLPYPRASSRKKMSMTDRAAQFSPFAALTGYDAAIQETARLTDRYVDLDADEKALLNEKMCFLTAVQEEHPEIAVTCFLPDDKKCGGSYVYITGRVKKVDPLHQRIVMQDGTSVEFDRIRTLSGEIFRYQEDLAVFEEGFE